METVSFEKLDAQLKYIADNSPIDGILGNTEVGTETGLLQKFGYVEIDSSGPGNTFIITPSGMKFYLEGGFKGYTDRNNVAKSDIELRIQMNKWYYKTKWLPYVISFSSLLISIIALIVITQTR